MSIKRYGYSSLNDRQISHLHSQTKGKRVLDLGAGNLDLSVLCSNSAALVFAIDSRKPANTNLPQNVSFIRACFDEVNIAADVALVSWPINNDDASMGLIKVLADVKKVIYIGTNDGCSTMCGTPLLWRHLVSREMESHLLGMNNLLVYSDQPRSKPLLDEEKNGLSAYD